MPLTVSNTSRGLMVTSKLGLNVTSRDSSHLSPQSEVSVEENLLLPVSSHGNGQTGLILLLRQGLLLSGYSIVLSLSVCFAI